MRFDARYRDRGFSLIELMVGMTIGLIAVIVVLQTLSFFENQKRTTTTGSDAQQNGLMGLFAIEQDVRNSGSGFASQEVFSCQNFYSYFDSDGGGPTPPIAATSFNSAPVSLINNAANARPFADAIVVRTGVEPLGAVPTPLSEDHLTAARILKVDRTYDINTTTNNLILVVGQRGATTNCALMRVTAKDDAEKSLTTASGQTPEYNPDIAYLAANNWPGYGATGTANQFKIGDLVYPIGNSASGGIVSKTYSINHPAGSNTYDLQVLDSQNAAATPDVLANQIVNIQAQYGLSGSNSTRAITLWRDPDHADVTSLSAQDLRKRVKAIRIVLIARASKREGEIVTPRCTATTTSGPCACQNATNNYGPCPWRDTSANQAPAIDLRGDDADTEWQRYRYKVFETVIPMRNTIWPNFS